MADDNHKNDDDLFDDDEDFGLPDLDYDDLDDEFDDDDLLEEEEIPEEEIAVEPVQESEPEIETPVVEEKPEEELTAVDDTDSPDVEEESEDWEKELEKELEDELSTGDIDSFYEEESFDEFESDESEVNAVFEADAEVTPDVVEDEVVVASGFVADEEVKAEQDDYYIGNIQKEEEAKAKDSAEALSDEEYNKYFGESAEKNKSNFTRTVVIGAVVLLLLGFGCLYLFGVFGSGEDKVAAKKEVAPKTVTKKPEAKPAAKPPAEKPKPKPKPEAKPKAVEKTPGEITTLTAATGKSYIIVASFFDGDMANDSAEELAKNGNSPMVIPPFNEYRFYRVAIAEFDSFADAKANLSQYQSEYGQDVWPLRY